MNMSSIESSNEPVCFKDAWNHPVKSEMIKWRNGIEKEINGMNDKNVWSIVKKDQVPKEKTIIGCKCVFKIKSDGKAGIFGLHPSSMNRIFGAFFSSNQCFVIKFLFS